MTTETANKTKDDNGLTVLVVLMLPTPWPPPSDVIAFCDEKLLVTMLFTRTGRIKVEVRDEKGAIIASGESARIRLRGRGLAFTTFCAVLKKDEAEVNLFINGALSNARTGLIRMDATTEPLKTGYPTPPQADVQSKEALKRRRQRAADYRRNAVNEERQAASLMREVRLLSSSIQRLKEGNSDEVVNVSLHLRKIIGRDKGNHSLQDYAALRDANIDVWTIPPPPPETWTPDELGSAVEVWSKELFSPDPTPLFTWAVDLDAWLERPGGVINGAPVNNINFLHAIADKIGAHLDIGDRPILDRMLLMKTFDRDFVQRYLLTLGDAIIALANRVMTQKS